MTHADPVQTPTFRVRRYDGTRDTDLYRMMALSREAWHPERAPYACFHPGDLCWRLREPSYERTLWLWEDARGGHLAGFAEWDPEASALEVQPHPRHAGGGESDVRARMLDWAGEQTAATAAVTTYAAEDDHAFAALLAARGYALRDGAWTNHHLRRLDAAGRPIETPTLPGGYAVRSLRRGPEEVAARVRGHRAGWQSTKLTEEMYARLMGTPLYRADLDLVAVAPDGVSFAATANCWLDGESGAGIFEPVSTDPAHRRRGLARALVLYGMARLRALGAKTAWVSSVSQNPAATALYENCGMAVVRRDFSWTRAVRSA